MEELADAEEQLGPLRERCRSPGREGVVGGSIGSDGSESAGQTTVQIAGAAWRVPLIVWLGAVSAMVTKGMLAAFLGAGIRRWIHDRVSPKIVRYVAVSLLLILGALSVIEILMTERA